MSDQPPYDRPEGGSAPYPDQGGVQGPPAGRGWQDQDQDQPGYDAAGGPPYEQQYGGAPRNGMGTGALVLGIIAVILAFLVPPLGLLLGVVAAVLGFLGRKKADRGEATNRGQATAGMALGIVAALIGAILTALVGSLIAENSEEFSNLADCLEGAADEQEQVACQEEFEGELGG